jgi:hypothetical protein
MPGSGSGPGRPDPDPTDCKLTALEYSIAPKIQNRQPAKNHCCLAGVAGRSINFHWNRIPHMRLRLADGSGLLALYFIFRGMGKIKFYIKNVKADTRKMKRILCEQIIKFLHILNDLNHSL